MKSLLNFLTVLSVILLLSTVTLSQPIGGGPIRGGNPASAITVNTTNFDGGLSAADTTVQTALETIDDALDDLEADFTKSFTINGATAADDFLLWRTSVDITITDIYGVLLTGTNIVGGLDECDANGANAVAVDADITFDGALDQDDGALTNGGIDAGDWIMWHTTSVNVPGYFTLTVVYTVD